MKYSNTLEYMDAINQLVKRNMDIIKLAKSENRELTEEEEKEFTENEEEVKELNDEKDELEKSLEDPKEEVKEDIEDEKEEKNYKNINVNTMEKKNFSLINEIRNSVKTGESIVLDRAYTVTSEGEDLVQTDVYNVIEPLRAKLALVEAGAHFMSGLKGDCQLPIMSAGNVFWAGETANASDGAGSFTSVTMSPKRLTAYVEVSLQLLAQDTVGAEQAIRNDLVKAIAQKLESTVLGSAAGSSTQPAGLLYGATPVGIESYADLCAFEADLEEDNVYGDMHFIVSPKAKAALRSMIRGTNNSGFVMEGNEVDGVPATSTSNVAANKLIYGNFNDLYIGTWSDVILDVVRDSASLKKGCVTLVVNMYVDAKLVRPESIAIGDTDPE